MHEVTGFTFASAAAGIKAGGDDCALIVSTTPAQCAGVFTRNKVIAAPLVVTRPRIAAGRCQAVLINSGNANACTGARGEEDARACAAAVARQLEIDEQLVAVASTGVIGVPLPAALLQAAVPALCGSLDDGGAAAVASAIMTTDSFNKVVSRQVVGTGGSYRLCAIAKGAGMIHPNMATMLAFVMTDAAVDDTLLQPLLKRAVDNSFNSITVDGDTSTNDMVLLLANAQAGNEVICPGSAAADEFAVAVEELLLELAKMIVRDGEGATKLVQIKVCGAVDDGQAKQAARSVATSNLVKTAFFGEDANWGRIIAAIGYADAVVVDPERIDIFFDDVQVVRDGLSTGAQLEEQAGAVLKRPEFCVRVDLHQGNGESSYYTSDLTYDYVKINADYRT